jgi:hypothetical protein
MTISKVFLLLLCLSSALLGGAIAAISGVSVGTCDASMNDTKADQEYFSREPIRSPKRGF